jgi:UDP-N-acetylmuramoylalanine--D-glutamate ligase
MKSFSFNDYQNYHILIIGPGASGISAAKLLKNGPVKASKISVAGRFPLQEWNKKLFDYVPQNQCFDQDSENLREEYLQDVNLIVLSPGVPPTIDLLVASRKRNIPVISEIELAFSLYKEKFKNSKLIAITGTNGKTTTATLLKELLTYFGKSVFLGGNIGLPFSEIFFSGKSSYDYVVLELSSFQLEEIHSFHPDLAMILNITPGHGERYDSVNKYAHAKFNIAANMTDDNLLLMSNDIIDLPLLEGKLSAPYKVLDCESSIRSLSEMIDLKNFQLRGEFNQFNLYFCLLALSHFRVCLFEDIYELTGFLETFTGVDFRLKKFRGDLQKRFKYLEIYNDAKSTNWLSTLKAAESFQDEGELTLILGGKLRGHGDGIGPYLAQLEKLVSEYLFVGESGQSLLEELQGRPNLKASQFANLDESLNYICETTVDEKKKIILYSPAFPSFDQYKNYIERGEHFEKLINDKMGSRS